MRRLLSHLLRPLYGSALQQRRSFMLDKLGKSVASKALTLTDDPLLPAGFGTRRFDGDGIAAKRRPIIEAGVLRNYLINVYYARKMDVDPTGGSTSNLVFTPGPHGLDALLKNVGKGVFVTGFIGGNSDTTRGDFSHGIYGFEIVDGKLGDPIGEMNITGNHTELWNRLAAVGNDPYPYSSVRAPTLVFDGVSVSGA